MVIVVTGGIASGKTKVTDILSEFGFRLIDADIISRELTAKGAEGARKIFETFGGSFFTDGELNRKAFSEYVFANPQELKKLNEAMHPLIFSKINQKITEFGGEDTVVCVPLYFESGHRISEADEVWTVNCQTQTRIKRLMLRDNISSAEHAQNIINAQFTDDERAERADRVIDNNGTLSELYVNVTANISKAREII